MTADFISAHRGLAHAREYLFHVLLLPDEAVVEIGGVRVVAVTRESRALAREDARRLVAVWEMFVDKAEMEVV